MLVSGQSLGLGLMRKSGRLKQAQAGGKDESEGGSKSVSKHGRILLLTCTLHLNDRRSTDSTTKGAPSLPTFKRLN